MENKNSSSYISVCMPTYKGLDYIEQTLDTVLSQSWPYFEIIISNDSPSDHDVMRKLAMSYRDKRIRFFSNPENLGYPLNLRKCVSFSEYEILFLMGQDDLILDKNVFEKVVKVFQENEQVGAITRPYYWFKGDPRKPIRTTISSCEKRIIGYQDDADYLKCIFETVGQLSGLAYRKNLISVPFNEHVFPAHIYPFLSIMKTHKVYFWEDYMIAVRTESSQTRALSSIYDPSPTKTWADMFHHVFPENQFNELRNAGLEMVGKNYVGLIQIKNHGKYKHLFADIKALILVRRRNLVNLKFWFIAFWVLLIPRWLLRRLVDFYKGVLNSFLITRKQGFTHKK